MGKNQSKTKKKKNSVAATSTLTRIFKKVRQCSTGKRNFRGVVDSNSRETRARELKQAKTSVYLLWLNAAKRLKSQRRVVVRKCYFGIWFTAVIT